MVLVLVLVWFRLHCRPGRKGKEREGNLMTWSTLEFPYVIILYTTTTTRRALAALSAPPFPSDCGRALAPHNK